MKGENTATENGAALIMIPVVVDDEPFTNACTWKSRPHSIITAVMSKAFYFPQLTSLGKNGPMTEYAALTKP